MATNRRFVLARRPDGEPRDDDFALVEEPMPAPGPGEMLLRTIYLSLDPYVRGRLDAPRSYAPRVEIGDTIVGDALSVVVASNCPGFAPGDIVEGVTGWRVAGLSDGSDVQRIDRTLAPLPAFLGPLGKSGHTAYHGLLNIAAPRAGETVVVAAAAGAVGSVVGQIAKLRGCRVVGIAGGPAKCAYLVGELGFDASVDRHATEFPAALRAACPRGIDVYFENVGGDVLSRVLPLLNTGARVPVCGQIAHYNGTADAEDFDRLPLLMGLILTRRLRFEGFIISDHAAELPAFRRWIARELASGRIKRRDHIIEGLERAPAAFRGLLAGETFGKAIVRVSPEPADTESE